MIRWSNTRTMLRQAPAVWAAALLLAGCVAAPPLAEPVPRAEAPQFDPFTFFLGESRGDGMLAKALSDDTPIRVESHGRIEIETSRDGGPAAPPVRVLVLDQVIREGDKPPRERQWRLHAVGPGRYAGTLSDAIGPVTARSEGNRLVIAFSMKGGLAVRQDITLSPDGNHAANIMQVSKLGLTVAVLAEDIRKTP